MKMHTSRVDRDEPKNDILHFIHPESPQRPDVHFSIDSDASATPRQPDE